MIRIKLSNFIQKNKDKIQDLLSKLIIVAIVVFIATIILSLNIGTDTEKQVYIKEEYTPKDTVITGTNVSEEQYTKDTNLVDKFLEFCNNGQVEEAYALLLDECREELYPTIEDFKKYYYNNIFDKKREYNLQAWLSTSKYTVYKIRYPNSMLSTGTYNPEDVYQDYITLNKKSNVEKISIGNFVYAQDCNIITKTDIVDATVTKKSVYLSYEEYEIQLKNKSEKTILLDRLEKRGTLRVVGNGIQYYAYTNKLFLANLTIKPNSVKTITIRFNKNLSSSNSSEKIEFSEVITDYDYYKDNIGKNIDTAIIKIKVEE